MQTLKTTAVVSGGSSASISTVASTFTPLHQATPVYVGVTGRSGGTGADDLRTFMLGGYNDSTLTMNVAAYDGMTGAWTPSMTAVRTGTQGLPTPRFGAAAAYLQVSW